MKPNAVRMKDNTTMPKLVRFFGLNTETPTVRHHGQGWSLSLIRIDEDEDRLVLFHREGEAGSDAQLFHLSKRSPGFTMVEIDPGISIMSGVGGGGGTIRAGICEWAAE